MEISLDMTLGREGEQEVTRVEGETVGEREEERAVGRAAEGQEVAAVGVVILGIR